MSEYNQEVEKLFSAITNKRMLPMLIGSHLTLGLAGSMLFLSHIKDVADINGVVLQLLIWSAVVLIGGGLTYYILKKSIYSLPYDSDHVADSVRAFIRPALLNPDQFNYTSGDASKNSYLAILATIVFTLSTVCLVLILLPVMYEINSRFGNILILYLIIVSFGIFLSSVTVCSNQTSTVFFNAFIYALSGFFFGLWIGLIISQLFFTRLIPFLVAVIGTFFAFGCLLSTVFIIGIVVTNNVLAFIKQVTS